MKVKDDRRYVAQATEITNAAGKIINSLRVELDYYKLSKSAPKPMRFMLDVGHEDKKEIK